MKKVNLLSKAEMKKVMGGNAEPALCDDWRTKSYDVCYQCCITVYSPDTCMEKKNCGDPPSSSMN